MILWQIGLVAVCLLILYFLKNGAIYLPAGQIQIEKIIELAQIQPGMRAVDLGSGDGRVMIALARAGAVVDGFEINPILVWVSRFRIWRAGLSGTAKVYTRNLWHQDLSPYNLVVVFGMTHIMQRLKDKLGQELKPETLVISNIFQFPNWPALTSERGVHVYKVPKIW